LVTLSWLFQLSYLALSLVVVHYLNAYCITSCEYKTYSKLIIYSYAMLTDSIFIQFFQAISRRTSKIIQTFSTINHPEFSSGNLLYLDRKLC